MNRILYAFCLITLTLSAQKPSFTYIGQNKTGEPLFQCNTPPLKTAAELQQAGYDIQATGRFEYIKSAIGLPTGWTVFKVTGNFVLTCLGASFFAEIPETQSKIYSTFLLLCGGVFWALPAWSSYQAVKFYGYNQLYKAVEPKQ